jgi:NAD(P)-dependent dehydrogenase (short-subunit alcohol dehydrogenase family)
MSLANQTIVILGGSSGIGLATARAAIADGAQVIITGRDCERLDHAVAQLGDSARGFAVDSSDEAGVQKLFAGIAHVDNNLAINGRLHKSALYASDSGTAYESASGVLSGRDLLAM